MNYGYFIKELSYVKDLADVCEDLDYLESISNCIYFNDNKFWFLTKEKTYWFDLEDYSLNEDLIKWYNLDSLCL